MHADWTGQLAVELAAYAAMGVPYGGAYAGLRLLYGSALWVSGWHRVLTGGFSTCSKLSTLTN